MDIHKLKQIIAIILILLIPILFVLSYVCGIIFKGIALFYVLAIMLVAYIYGAINDNRK